MADDGSIRLTGRVTVEDVMVALAKQSIFDLPALAEAVAKKSQERAEAENEPDSLDILAYPTFALIHMAEAE